jgi:acyl carrier protein
VRFWKQRYVAIEPPRALPTDHARRAGMTGAGAVQWVHVDKALTERLRDVAREAGATLNMLVMAVYAAMMSQAVGSRSLVMGVPVRGRLLAEVEPVMGFFNNLLPAHLDVDAAQPLSAWVGRVKAELLDVFAHQDVPFERLVSEPEIARYAHRAGLYQTLFSFQDARERERRWGPLAHASVLVMQKGATEDFGLWLMEVPGGLEGGINYNADLFEARTAQLFRDRLIGLLERVAADPSVTVQALLVEPGDDATAFAGWIRERHATAAPPSPATAAAAIAMPQPEQRAAGAAAQDASGQAVIVVRSANSSAPTAGVAPAAARASLTATEQALAQIWSELLGLPAHEITARDNFFDLGGNSLLAMQAAQAIVERLGKRVPANAVVMDSLAQLALSVDAAQAAAPAVASAATATTSAGGLFKRLGSVLRR